MARLHDAFAHLLPVLDDYIPLANLTAIYDAVPAADTVFLQNFLSDTNMLLLSRDDPLPPVLESFSSPNDSFDGSAIHVVSALTFHTGRKRGQQCSYNGYLYTLNKTRADEHRYWDCKDRRYLGVFMSK